MLRKIRSAVGELFTAPGDRYVSNLGVSATKKAIQNERSLLPIKDAEPVFETGRSDRMHPLAKAGVVAGVGCVATFALWLGIRKAGEVYTENNIESSLKNSGVEFEAVDAHWPLRAVGISEVVVTIRRGKCEVGLNYDAPGHEGFSLQPVSPHDHDLKLGKAFHELATPEGVDEIMDQICGKPLLSDSLRPAEN
jgi:hypothetical protein